MNYKKKEEFLDSNLDENQEPANLENDFLKEIHQKINKRSGGLYYNKKLKSIKKNLSITSFVVVFVIILWALINFISQKVSVSPDVKSNKTTVETHGRASLQGNKNEIKKIIKQKFKSEMKSEYGEVCSVCFTEFEDDE